MENDNQLYCPFCGSTHLTANKKGFGAGKALTGAVLTGGIGLLAGFIGSGNVKVTCLKCGRQWKPGELRTEPIDTYQKGVYKRYLKAQEEQRKKEEAPASTETKIILWIAAIMFAVIFYLMSKS